MKTLRVENHDGQLALVVADRTGPYVFTYTTRWRLLWLALRGLFT